MIFFFACLVWISRVYLFWLSPVHLDPAHVLAFKNVWSLSLLRPHVALPLYLSAVSVWTIACAHFPENIWLVLLFESLRSAAQLLLEFHRIWLMVKYYHGEPLLRPSINQLKWIFWLTSLVCVLHICRAKMWEVSSVRWLDWPVTLLLWQWLTNPPWLKLQKSQKVI